MKKIWVILVLGLLVASSAFASNLNPEKILDSVDDLYRSNASHGILTLSVTTVNWQRTLTLEQWSKGEDKSLLELLAIEAKLLEASSDKFFNISRKLKEAAANLEKQIEEYNETPRFPFETGPREYQKEAYSNWKQNDFKGIFLMATGTGKTITALNCLLNIYEMEGYYQSVILVPGKTLLKQWIGEAKSFNFRNIIPCSSEFKTWEQDLNKLQSNLRFNKKKSFVLITTYTTFSSEKFQRYFTKIPSPALLIADEAHAFGSPKLKTILEKLHIERRIALSATIKRQFDEDGNQAIEHAFNSRHPYTYNFPMSKAIQEGVLCKYDYFFMKPINKKWGEI